MTKPGLDPAPVFESEIDVARDLADRINELLGEVQPLSDYSDWQHVAAIADAIGHLGAAVVALTAGIRGQSN
jgi:hypothetical protein